MIDRNSDVPLHAQVSQRLKQMIRTGELPEGARIGSEAELSEQYGVSRVTIRQALTALRKDGYVITRHGKGSYVAGSRLVQELGDLESLGEIVQAQGMQHAVRVLDYRWILPPPHVAGFFQARDQEPTLRVQRQHTVNGVPLAAAVIYVPVSIGAHISREELEAYPLYTLMEKKLGIGLGQALQTMRAGTASREISETLSVRPGYTFLIAERQTYSSAGDPVEHITFYYRADCYQFRVRLERARSLPLVVPPFPDQGHSRVNQEGGMSIDAVLQLTRDPAPWTDT